MTKFKQLSYWARQHKWPSRFIIVFSFIIMNLLGIITGFLFSDLNIIFSTWFILLSMAAFSIVWLTYPTNKQKSLYVFRKTYDIILVGTTFLMFIYFGNRQVSPISSTLFSASAVTLSLVPKDSTRAYRSLGDFRKSLHDENGKPLKWKERKRLLKQQIKAIKTDRITSDGEKVLLIILCVLLAAALAFSVGALSCSLSCSGSEGAAVVVAILGLAGVALLTFFMIRGITRKSKREKEKNLKEEKAPANN